MRVKGMLLIATICSCRVSHVMHMCMYTCSRMMTVATKTTWGPVISACWEMSQNVGCAGCAERPLAVEAYSTHIRDPDLQRADMLMNSFAKIAIGTLVAHDNNERCLRKGRNLNRVSRAWPGDLGLSGTGTTLGIIQPADLAKWFMDCCPE